MPLLLLIIQQRLTFPYTTYSYYNSVLHFLPTSQGAFCAVCSEDSNGISYHRSMGQCKPCEGSMLPAIVGLLVALAVLLMLLAALRTSKGRKLLSKLRPVLMSQHMTKKGRTRTTKQPRN